MTIEEGGGRVAWTRYSGDEIEATVAMMVNREKPNSVRITPSKGDGGIDILDKGAATDGGDVVYQVKRYASPPTAGQKAAIRKSLARLLGPEHRDPRWINLNVTEWLLVMPWDPTPEACSWFHSMTESYSIKAFWHGLAMIDGLASKYPDVIDYYLHGGRSVVRQAYREMAALMSLPLLDDGGLSVVEVSRRVQTALQALDRDPHYIYEHRFGHGETPRPGARPRLAMSWFHADSVADRWEAVDVIARCEASCMERPITVTGVLTVKPGSRFADEVKAFVEFGSPFTSPTGAFTGQVDAPGGLGGPIANAMIATFPARVAPADDARLRLEIRDPTGEVVAGADVDRSEVSQGKLGVRSVLREVNEAFVLVMMFNFKEQTTMMTFKVDQVVGKPVSTVFQALDFLAAFRAPNHWSIRPRFAGGGVPGGQAIPESPDESQGFTIMRDALAPLSELQKHSRAIIRVPDLDRYVDEQRHAWECTAALLRGEALSLTAPEGYAMYITAEPGTAAPHGSFAALLPLRTQVGEETVDFGRVLVWATDVTLVRQSTTDDGNLLFQFDTPDHTVHYRLPTTEELAGA